MKRNDRNNPSPGTSNGMMLAELKHLKATLAAKDKRIKELGASRFESWRLTRSSSWHFRCLSLVVAQDLAKTLLPR